MILPTEFVCQLPRAFACPTQWRLGMSARNRINQGLQRLSQCRVHLLGLLASATWPPNPRMHQCLRIFLIFQLTDARQNGRPRHASRLRNTAHAASAHLNGLRRGPLSAHPFIHYNSQGPKLTTNPFYGCCIMHSIEYVRELPSQTRPN